MAYNPAVEWVRPNFALQTLVAELRAKWGNPTRPPEFITGYKAPTNATGHNPDSNGIIHGVDLFFSNSSAWNEDRGWELAEWLRTVEVPRGQTPGQPQRAWYTIYRDHLTAAWTGHKWAKRPDGSGYQHWDHIHISTTDLLWGSPIALPAADYDSRAPWGFGSTITTQSTITPIEIEDDNLDATQFNALVGKIDELNAAHHVATREHINGKIPDIAKAVVERQVPHKDPVTGKDSGQTTSLATMAGFADFQATQTRELVKQGPAAIAARIDAAGLAIEVRDHLAKLIGGK